MKRLRFAKKMSKPHNLNWVVVGSGYSVLIVNGVIRVSGSYER